MTNEPFILEAVTGYRIPFSSIPFQIQEPNPKDMSPREFAIVDELVREYLDLGAA